MPQHPDQAPEPAPGRASERAVQALLAAATADGPPATDLLAKVRRRPLGRRVLVPSLATLATAGVVAALALAGPAMTGAPPARASARELVAAAVARTAQDGYRVRVTSTKSTPAGISSGTVEGAFDPARGTGVLDLGEGLEVRYVGGIVYRELPAEQATREGMPEGIRWIASPQGRPEGISELADFGDRALRDPRRLLDRMRSAGDVREQGPVAGDGWSGVRYVFVLTDRHWRVTGSVDVDGDGRVRRLELTSRATDRANGLFGTVRGTLEFWEFGPQKPVTAPPAAQVERLPTPEEIKARREAAARR
jgi:hypothetical protein